jgi:L-ascorbate metabolism protein UlaG (beta-lactamase superfamily)
MSTQIKFLGIATFEITLPDDRVVLIDPCLDDNPASPVKVADLDQVDLVLVTHLALDHLGDAAAIARRFRCPVVCGKEVKYFLRCHGVDPEQIRTVPWHGQVNPLGIRVRSVPSMHASMGIAPDGQWLCGAPMGFILYAAEDCRIYHSGDSAIFSDLKLIGQLYQPNVGLMCACELEQEYLLSLGLKDHYGNEMSGDEGALAAAWLGVEYAICCHYLDPDGRPDVEKFVSVLSSMEGPKPVVLRPGQVFAYPPKEE